MSNLGNRRICTVKPKGATNRKPRIDNDAPAPKKRGPKPGTVKRPDVSKRNREKPSPQFVPNPSNERTFLVSGRISNAVADYLIPPKERMRIVATSGKMKWGERIEAAIRRLIEYEGRL